MGAAVFLVEAAALGLPASAFLVVTAFFVGAGLTAALVTLALTVEVAFLVDAFPVFNLEGGLEFWGIRVNINH